MNQKERAINLGLKINSLKGNFSVAKSVIFELETEINEALIDDADRKKLLELYTSAVRDLKKVVSPSASEKGRFNQLVEDVLKDVINASSYLEADKIEGSIISIEEALVKTKLLKKEHKAAITHRIEKLREKHRVRVGYFLKKNFDKLIRDIKLECDNSNPFHVSVVVKKYNSIVKTTPLFTDDRHAAQALLDTNWQKASSDIKERKKAERESREKERVKICSHDLEYVTTSAP